jgi:hypothetical protein
MCASLRDATRTLFSQRDRTLSLQPNPNAITLSSQNQINRRSHLLMVIKCVPNEHPTVVVALMAPYFILPRLAFLVLFGSLFSFFFRFCLIRLPLPL